MNNRDLPTSILVLGLLASASSHAIATGQVDNFQDGTTQSWTEGGPSPNQPQNIADGGPGGTGDSFLENVSSGFFGPGGALIMFNFTQWTGDYIAAGVTSISMDVANLGIDDLQLRIAIEGAAGSRYGTTDAFLLPADGAWYSASFGLDAAALTLIEGGDSLDAVLAGVTQLRIMSAEAGPSWVGDFVAATLGTDNIRALSPAAVPLPAALPLLSLALASLGLAGLRR